MMKSRLTRLVQLESEVAYRAAPDPGQNEFGVLAGRIPVLLSAPHGAAHIRNGRLKEEDEYTSGLVRLVAEETGAHALYALRKSSTDPNYYANTTYKRTLQQLVKAQEIKFLLDIHGCSPDRGFGIALGTMHGRSCPEQRPLIIHALTRHGFSESNRGLMRLDLDETFPANGSERIETITQFAFNKLGIPAAQIELNAHLRIVQHLPGSNFYESDVGDPEKISHMLDTLIDLVKLLNSA